jgi:hypothetical protein
LTLLATMVLDKKFLEEQDHAALIQLDVDYKDILFPSL